MGNSVVGKNSGIDRCFIAEKIVSAGLTELITNDFRGFLLYETIENKLILRVYFTLHHTEPNDTKRKRFVTANYVICYKTNKISTVFFFLFF